MGERVVSIISSVAIINLLLTAVVCWFKSKHQRFYFWLGWLIFSAALAMLNNLHIFLGYGHIWFYHLALGTNLSFGAYLILFIGRHKMSPPLSRFKKIALFAPSILYVPFIIYCWVEPQWAIDTINLAREGKMTIFSTFYNLTIVFYSVGTNIYLLVGEWVAADNGINKHAQKRRREILAVMLVLQLMAFVPFVLKADLKYIILYMPVFGQLYYLYLFVRIWSLGQTESADSMLQKLGSGSLQAKYATIKLPEDKILDIQNQIIRIMTDRKPYLMPDYALSDLANALGITSNTVSMVINSKLGFTFPDLINKYRVEYAKALLLKMKKNNSTIESVAYDCGFNNRTSFYAAFRRFANQSPTQYISDNEKRNLSVG